MTFWTIGNPTSRYCDPGILAETAQKTLLISFAHALAPEDVYLTRPTVARCLLLESGQRSYCYQSLVLKEEKAICK